jgi:F-type H+-transporting ATPase subunit delta
VDAELMKEFEILLSQMTDKTVELKEKVDDSIVGGFKIQLGDRQIDDTIRTKLDSLALKFKEQVYID